MKSLFKIHKNTWNTLSVILFVNSSKTSPYPLQRRIYHSCNSPFEGGGGMSSVCKIKSVNFGTIVLTLITIFLLSGCDKVYNEVTPQEPPVLPQVATEAFKQMYPDVATFVFKPLQSNKTWQNDFVASTGKVTSVVDYQGEIIELNQLIGTPKILPNSLKNYVFSKYPNAVIVLAYDMMKTSTQTDGYKLTVQTDKNTFLNLFFDASNNFLREEKKQIEKVTTINFTSTDQINLDPKTPLIVKQFIANNQIPNASVTIYTLADKTYKVILNFRERIKGALLTNEITVTEQGQLLEWVSPIETEIFYNTLTSSNLSSDVSNYFSSYSSNTQLDYAFSSVVFGRSKFHYATFQNGAKESVTLIDDILGKDDLVTIRSVVLEEKDLPQNIKTVLDNNYPTGVFSMGKVTYEPKNEATQQGGTTPAHYQIEMKQGSDRYAIRIANDGKVMFKYKIV
jgi:hypothetical protein